MKSISYGQILYKGVKMDIIIPCAGQSTRFPNMRPKYLLCDYKGRSMIQLAAEPYLYKHTVHISILHEHDEKYQAVNQLKSMFGNIVNIVVLPKATSGPAETIDQTLSQLQLSRQFLVKDCDNIFNHADLAPGNNIFVDTLTANPNIQNPSNKSYVSTNDWGIVNTIVEKKITSDIFCVGGYQFISTDIFKEAYNDTKLSRIQEIYISSIIDHLITCGEIFSIVPVTDYIDFGTFEDWKKYNDKPTIFCDIDGSIVENQSLHGSNNYETWPRILDNNVATLLRAKKRGAQIVFTTSRPSRFESATRNLLTRLGFGDCQLLMDMHHAQRILINDYAPSNPWPSALAINIKRNDDSLDQLLKY